jgi:hypothetical protein
LCGDITPYKFSDHIDNRYGYVEGLGQLCKKCYVSGTNKNQLIIPASIVINTSNDAELGAKIRNLYWLSK